MLQSDKIPSSRGMWHHRTWSSLTNNRRRAVWIEALDRHRLILLVGVGERIAEENTEPHDPLMVAALHQTSAATSETICFVVVRHDLLMSSDAFIHDMNGEHNEDVTQYHQLNEEITMPSTSAASNQSKNDIFHRIIWSNDPLYQWGLDLQTGNGEVLSEQVKDHSGCKSVKHLCSITRKKYGLFHRQHQSIQFQWSSWCIAGRCECR